jgi:hypothetical protein
MRRARGSCGFFVGLLALMASAFSASAAADFVEGAQHHRLPSFEDLAAARFDTPGDGRFEAFERWVHSPDPPARGRPKTSQRQLDSSAVSHCARAEARGTARAMVEALRKSPSREAANAAWQEARQAWAEAQSALASARRPSRTTRPNADPFARELLRRVAVDQALRGAQFTKPHNPVAEEVIGWTFWAALCRSDWDNVIYLKKMLAKRGWPTLSRDGEETGTNAWLIAQHADDDRDFQAYALGLMEKLLPAGEVNGRRYALLYDRVALARGGPQRYGSQFTQSDAGCLAPQPLENPEAVDDRRRAVGLPPLADYAKELEQAYHVRSCTEAAGASPESVR